MCTWKSCLLLPYWLVAHLQNPPYIIYKEITIHHNYTDKKFSSVTKASTPGNSLYIQYFYI